MTSGKTTKAERQPAEKKQPAELTDQQLEGAQGGIRAEQLNNKYPENMKHEVREHVQNTSETIDS